MSAATLRLPPRLESEKARRSLRPPADHEVVNQIAWAKWQLTERGFRPWAGVYRPVRGKQRAYLQCTIVWAPHAPSWNRRSKDDQDAS